MINFQRTARSAPNYLGRREQRRLLLWVMAIGLPLIVIAQAIEFFRTANSPPPKPDEMASIDPRLPSRAGLALDEFTIEPDLLEDNDELAGDNLDQDPANPPQRDRYFRGVLPAYLKSVRDDTPSRRADQDACYNLLTVLKRNDLAELKAASQGDVTYVQLFRQPDFYRGRLVDVRGIVRRAHRIALPQNHSGVSHYYQLWLFTPDGGEHPMVVYALDLPEGFPTGMKIHERVAVTGFFFKRVAYGAEGGGMTAPMLLAKTVEWSGVSPAEQQELEAANQRQLKWLVGIAAGGVVLLTLLMWRLNRALRTPIVRRREMSPGEAEQIGREPVESVEEQLRKLSQQDL